MDYTKEKTIHREKKLHIVIPYINELNPIISKFFNNYNTEVVNNTVNKWNCFIKLGKDVSSKDEKTNVVYRIHCNECTATYVGQTERRLNIRVNEHMKKCAKKDGGSAIKTHMEGSNHKFNFDKVKVLQIEQSLGKRKLAEMLFIHAQKQYIKNQQDTKTLRFEYKTRLSIKTISYNSISHNSTITVIVQY